MESGTGAAQFPEKEYIHGIFVAVYDQIYSALAQSELKSISRWLRRGPCFLDVVLFVKEILVRQMSSSATSTNNQLVNCIERYIPFKPV